MEDGSVWWHPAEEISVFYGGGTCGGRKFTSQNTSPQKLVEFGGFIQVSGYEKDVFTVYPYSQDNACDGHSITTVIPDVQAGSEGNFSGDAFPAIAKSNSYVFAFRNICGGVKFCVSRNDIRSVIFKGNCGEVLAGKVRVSFNSDGRPEVAEVLNSKTELTLNAPDGGVFKAGEYYYLSLLPVALDGGFTMTFVTENEKGLVISHNPQVIKRSVFGVLESLDSKVSKWKSTRVEPEWVDLGLPSGLKWATFNVGASKPEEWGDYFAWGETEPQKDYKYMLSTYKWCNGTGNVLTKYCTNSSYWNGSAPMDNKTVLELEDDAAHINWGGGWRMPTDAEWTELQENCTWTKTEENGYYGHLVTSKTNNNSIFLPAAGYRSEGNFNNAGYNGCYWSSSLCAGNPCTAFYVFFGPGYVLGKNNDRYAGLSVRAVYGNIVYPKSVSLNKSTLSLRIGDSEQLTATVLPSTASVKSVVWSSDDTAVAAVDDRGIVSALKAGTATIIVTTTFGDKTATCEVTVKDMSLPAVVEAVDLGLPSGLKWATCNVGADMPEDYGGYFAWGETEPKLKYSWSTYKWCNGEYNKLTKYCTQSSYWDSTEPMDNKTTLDLEDDAARANWGGSWRMPTGAEWDELIINCTWTWTTQNGINGKMVTGPNGKGIFLPAAGYRGGTAFDQSGALGHYGASSLHTPYIPDTPNFAWAVVFNSVDAGRYYYSRYLGYPVRPVTE